MNSDHLIMTTRAEIYLGDLEDFNALLKNVIQPSERFFFVLNEQTRAYMAVVGPELAVPGQSIFPVETSN